MLRGVLKRIVTVAFVLVIAAWFMAGGTPTPANAAPLRPESCADIRAASPNAGDGNYVIYPNGRGFVVYCYDMAGSPREYLTLDQQGGSANYSSFWPNATGPMVTTRFDRIRINPQTLTVDRNDYTFSHSDGVDIWGRTQVPYASAGECAALFDSQGNAMRSDYGRGHLDLTGTPFAIAQGQFVPQGYIASGTATYSDEDRVVSLTGGGHCGSTEPVGYGPLQLVWRGPSILDNPPAASCAEVKALRPGAVDGEYVIYPNGTGMRVYCHDMAGTPREYLTLDRTGGSFNFSSWWPNATGPTLTTWFNKVRFDPQSLTVDRKDYTFTNSAGADMWGVAQAPFGYAGECAALFDSSGHALLSDHGRGNVTLTGTPFVVALGQFSAQGYIASGTATYADLDRVVNLTGGGHCGWTSPDDPDPHLAWLGHPLRLLWRGPAILGDVTPPIITGAPDRAPNGAWWYNRDVTVTFTCSDPESGVHQCSGPTTLGPGAHQSVTGTAMNHYQSTASYTVSGINIDETAPTSTATLSGTPAPGGGYLSPVRVDITAVDNAGGSGVAITYFSVDGGALQTDTSVTIDADGAHTVTHYSVDVAGNSEAPKQLPFVVVTPAPLPAPPTSDRLQLNGLNNGAYVEVADQPDLRLTTGLTLEGWVSWDGTNGYKVFLSKPSADYTSGYHLVVWDGKPMLQIGVPGEWREAKGPATLPVRQWVHIAGTYDGRWSRLYVNGTEVAARDYGTVKSLVAGPTSLLIGREFTTPGFLTDRTFGGALDNLRVWNAALPQATIAAYQSSTDLAGHPNLGNLRAFWRFDEGAGATVADASGRGHTGTLHGAVWSGLTINVPAEVRTPATGASGAAVTYTVTAVDPVDGTPQLACTPAVGAVFPLGTTTVTCTANDKPGNVFTRTFPVTVYDNLPPVTTATVSPAANGFGWRNADTTVAMTATDDASGVKEITYSATGAGALPVTSVPGSTASLVLSADGLTTVSYRAADNAANVETPQSLEVRIDKTPPTIAGSATAAPNAAGWYSGDVTIHWTVGDAMSGIDTAPADVVIAGEGSNLGATATVGDKAGNSATAAVSGIKIDRTNPEIAATRTPANGFGWNNGPVTVTFACSDALSGVAACPAPVTLTQQGTDQSVTGTVVDNAGNSATAAQGDINIDKTKPVVTYTGNAGSYTVDQVVAIDCASSDGLSGVAGDTCVDIAGPAYSFTIGMNSYSATATDKADNVGSGSTSFTISATFDSLCALGAQFSTNPDVTRGLCDKLAAAKAADARGNAKAKAGQIGAYINQVEAQTGKAFTKAQAALLTRLVKLL